MLDNVTQLIYIDNVTQSIAQKEVKKNMQKINVSVRLEEALYEDIKALADDKERKPTELIRLVLKNFVKQQKQL